jgi:hypothetical protein
LVTFVNLFFALKNGFTKDIFSIFISIWLATLISHSATFNTTLSLWYFLPIFATSLIFMAISYYLSNRENLEFLYTLGTIFTIIILSIIIQLK